MFVNLVKRDFDLLLSALANFALTLGKFSCSKKGEFFPQNKIYAVEDDIIRT